MGCACAECVVVLKRHVYCCDEHSTNVHESSLEVVTSVFYEVVLWLAHGLSRLAVPAAVWSRSAWHVMTPLSFTSRGDGGDGSLLLPPLLRLVSFLVFSQPARQVSHRPSCCEQLMRHGGANTIVTS